MHASALLDDRTVALLRAAAATAGGKEPAIRRALTAAIDAGTPPEWVEELLLQSILMVGYPRALIAFGIWRAVSGRPAPATDADAEYAMVSTWEQRGEATCGAVYGANYSKLRSNVRALHPAVDRWMLVEGYGRTLGRAGLDLMRRELCTVVQTAVLRTPRQMHSHLRGALNGGATVAQVEQALALVTPELDPAERAELARLWSAVRAGWMEAG
ncbi:MAG TPA: carboxymuconolactone decarboxylase family protein [Gemmatimonadales bacterium]|nr:carboxymuconolactone decarboxylase family protein [Gemmatimonadales bacterium]